MRLWFLLTLLTSLVACAPAPVTNTKDAPVGANDNRVAAGALRNGTLRVNLEVTAGDWRPDHTLPAMRVLSFAEAGNAPTAPGPLIRVQQGTMVEASVSNRLGQTVWIHGLHARPGAGEPLQIPPRGTVMTRFAAETPGSYYYFGTLQETFSPDDRENGSDSELNGALIVDAPGMPKDDRVFVISLHLAGKDGPAFWTINGGSWPDTERLTYSIGDKVAWRWLNTTSHHHPMHLHGHYFTVTSRGDNWLDRPVAAAEQHPVVTHALEPGATMAVKWSPATAGNWLFHCHILFHVMPENRLSDATQWFEEYADLPHDAHMAGLVLGIHVLPAGTSGRAAVEREPSRAVRLRIGERGGAPYSLPGLKIPRLGYAVDDGPVTSPGAPLVLERGRPVEITIVNGIAHSTAVHWHGVELESYYDGVPHWGGTAGATTPAIAAGESFTARLVPPRAGTFIYHTHFNDFVQLTGGLYGALLVVEPGTTIDAATDHTYVVSLGGGDEFHDPTLINGASEIPAVTWHVGQRHRLRLININPVSRAHLRLTRGEATVTWRALAKDGADLPANLATARNADVTLYTGETADFEAVADATGVLQLEAALSDSVGPRASAAINVVP